MARSRPARLGIKRCLDVVFAASGLIALAPLMLLIGLAIRISMGGPVLYRQLRPGLEGRPFELIKFRTMRDALDDAGRPVPQELRPTRLGYWLRKTSLDEIPELWAILKGDMSLVGPRPLLLEYLPLYTAEQARRHTVKPGLTGLAQVMGRHTISWEQRFAYDVRYVDQWSLRLDAWIMLRTLRSLTSGDGRRPAYYFTGSSTDDATPDRSTASPPDAGTSRGGRRVQQADGG